MADIDGLSFICLAVLANFNVSDEDAASIMSCSYCY